MEYRFNLDEVLIMISEAIQAGYHYGSFDIMEPDDESNESGEGATLCLTCDDCGGEEGVEYDPIDSVPLAEVEKYGHCGQAPAPERPCCKVEE